MSLLDEIRREQRRAGEDALIRKLEHLGLYQQPIRTENQPICQKCGQTLFAETREEVERLSKDAARYRFLRDSKNAYPLFFIAQRDPNNVVVQFTGELADINIDEMMLTHNSGLIDK